MRENDRGRGISKGETESGRAERQRERTWWVICHMIQQPATRIRSSETSTTFFCTASFSRHRVRNPPTSTEKALAFGRLVKVPWGILSRCAYAFSKVLATDPSRQDESERQRMEARQLRLLILDDGGRDLDGKRTRLSREL